MRQGLIAAVTAYLIWGLFPIYWKFLQHVPAAQIMAHRIVWCLAFVLLWLAFRDGFGWLRRLSPRLLAMLAGSSLLITANWGLYIWAIVNGHVVETSLGYFISPLVNVLLGVLILRERLNTAQWIAVTLAGLGVAWLTWQAGRPPWIALGLAGSFGAYGLVRKLAEIPAVPGLAVESGLVFLPAVAYLGWQEHLGVGHFGHHDLLSSVLLVIGGLITAVPLVLFAVGARRIPLSLVGLLQYLTPTLVLLCGVLLYREPFTLVRMIGFGCIWVGLAIYATDGVRRMRSRQVADTPG